MDDSTLLRSPMVLPSYDPKRPYAIICNIDNTLAVTNGRTFQDIEGSKNDGENEITHAILKAFSLQGRMNASILFVTERAEMYRSITEAWLRTTSVYYDALYMRPDDDTRSYAEVKKDVYLKKIKSRYNVIFVLEDQRCVVDMYRRELGLPVLQIYDAVA